MPSLVTNSKIWGEMFGTEKMQNNFSDEATIQFYLDVESALARAQSKLKIIPKEAGIKITEASNLSWLNWETLKKRTQIVGYPILPLVEQLSLSVEDGYGQYCHWGATTQDIMDTADVLQIRKGLDLLSNDLNAIALALANIVKKYKDTPMAGRTHLQHALPIPFGYKAATWLSSIDRHIKRLEEIKSRIFNVSFFGAAGTLASLGEQNGLNTQAQLAKELNLEVPDVSWHSIRDNFCEVTGWLALVGASLGKIAYDVILMMQTETQEVAEPFLTGRGASSTMPQKRNPISSEVMLACSKILRELHSSMLDAMVLDHERATGQWHVEWYSLPNAFIISSACLSSARYLLEGLEVSPENMNKNMNKTNGLIVAESVMMSLAPHIGRQVAHDLVYDCCRDSIKNKVSLIDTLYSNKTISDIFDKEQLIEIVDPASYLGAGPAMAQRLLDNR
ncbi:adenylosuccinate lyase family protein [Alphaproteobacteria bacterium]|jgi:3-carboxy-cis,cis-muconate cycloisomerase|nr:adenylosuccinate lyase family protein [Alphaproteobacteria bacterium]